MLLMLVVPAVTSAVMEMTMSSSSKVLLPQGLPEGPEVRTGV